MTRSRRRPQMLLAAGVLVGLASAVAGLLGGVHGAGMPADAVAVVNGVPIRQDAYERAVAALTADRRNPVGAEERRFVLDRLIDEELLVQRAVELGLLRQDRRVRGELVSALIASVVADAADGEPSASDIEGFYREHRDYFTRPGRVHVRQVVVRVAGDDEDARGALARAEAAAHRLRAGEGYALVRAELGDEEIATLPDAPQTLTTLRDYLGPTVARAAFELAPGEVSAPVRSTIGWHVLQMVAREPERVPPLGEIDAEVRAEARRKAGDEAVRAYLDELRGVADVRIRGQEEPNGPAMAEGHPASER